MRQQPPAAGPEQDRYNRHFKTKDAARCNNRRRPEFHVMFKTQSVAVMLGLVGAFGLHTDIGGLVAIHLGQFYTDAVKM